MRSVIVRARTIGFAAAIAIGGIGALPALPAAAASTNWNVQVGNESPTSPAGVNKFYLNDITVHPGDTVTFNFQGFHTVTFNPPPNLSLFDFVGFTGVPVGSTTLDTPTTFVNLSPFFPAANVVTIGANLPPGEYHYWCQIHQFMHGVIRVTNGALPSTDAQNQASAQAQVAADTARAANLQARLLSEATDEEGHALVGAGDRSTEFVEFFPSQITVHVGERLTFEQRDLHEPHTVTFGPLPGGPSLVPGAFPSGPGNPGAFDGTSALNSGLLFHESQYDYWRIGLTPFAAAVPRTRFSVTFTTPGTYNFYCAIHGGIDPATGAVFGMSGHITVLPAQPDE